MPPIYPYRVWAASRAENAMTEFEHAGAGCGEGHNHVSHGHLGHRAESALSRLLRPYYSRGDDEARALLREAFTLTGDLQITGDTLHVRLDPASAPRRSKALAALCVELTDTATRYPGTDLALAYSVKHHS